MGAMWWFQHAYKRSALEASRMASIKPFFRANAQINMTARDVTGFYSIFSAWNLYTFD